MSPPVPHNRMASRSRRRRVFFAAVVLLLLVSTAAAAMAGWHAVQRSGRTPAEILDYIDHRLEGHNKLVWAAQPFLGAMRRALDAPSIQQRMAMPFPVPPPPPRRGASDIPAPPPVPVGATVWRVGPRGQYLRIADVARLAKDGDVVEIEAGDYRGDVATWEQKRLTIRGVNGAARLFADGRNAEGKAIWVLRDGEFDIANIDFIGATAEDQNGAGIRFERGTLRLRHCLFWGNQMGLVTAGLPHAVNTRLEIEASEFAYSHVPGRWGHNLYVGAIDHLRVAGSYFHHAGSGHLLKSRAAVNEIVANRFSDESGGRASYELDFPNGGRVRLVGNVVQQQPGTENGIMISVGEEGYTGPRTTVELASNTLVNDHPYGGAFLRVAPGAQSVKAQNNLLVGPGRYLVQDPIDLANDQEAEWQDLARPARHDYRLRRRDGRFAYRAPTQAELVPRLQYVHGQGAVPLVRAPETVGADQRQADDR
jgi:hypothetical protein